MRWIQTIGTGVDHFPLGAGGRRILACSRGGSAVPIAEWVLSMLLAFEKRLPQSWVSAPPEHWNMAELGVLEGKTLGLVGIGGIGVAVARRALPFGMRVQALRRTPSASSVPEVEVVGKLEELLAAADHMVAEVEAYDAKHGRPGA